MSSFKIRCSALGRKRTPSELDATFCRLEMLINDRPITEYVTDDQERETHLEIPSYYLAEWIAENWWALLNEPRKSDEETDAADFLARHSVAAAQHGFPLPSLLIVPVGKDVHLSATPRTAPFADIKFVGSASAFVGRAEVEGELARLVDQTLGRIREWHIADTPLEEAWDLVKGTTPEEADFCRLVGALGLSPYDVHDEIAQTIDQLFEQLGERELRDLCFASTRENLISSAGAAVRASEAMLKSPTISLEPITKIQLPPESPDLPGYRRGVSTAIRVRQRLGISETDPNGGDAFFEKLKLSPGSNLYRDSENTQLFSLTGAVARDNDNAQMILLQETEAHRRFTAARAMYLAWVSGLSSKRLVTNAVTRNQQASRAFAAELLAPISYIRLQRRGRALSADSVYEIAGRLRVGPDVVYKQAVNNGVQVTPT